MMRSMLCRREPYRSLSHRRPRAVPQPVMEHRWSPISLCSRALISSTTPTGSRSQQINDRGWRSSEQAANLLRLSAAARAIFRSRNLWGSRSCRPRWNNAIASGVTCTLLLRRLFFRVRSGISAVVLTCSKPTVARSGLGRSDSGRHTPQETRAQTAPTRRALLRDRGDRRYSTQFPPIADRKSRHVRSQTPRPNPRERQPRDAYSSWGVAALPAPCRAISAPEASTPITTVPAAQSYSGSLAIYRATRAPYWIASSAEANSSPTSSACVSPLWKIGK
ncbi:hypothetical protein ABIC01_002440 [Bradyrhizobium sp. RT4b]